ncbi:hypothetical protein NP233_g5330 [Leucocoprinus birnbaumii]|uniref:Carboxylic ester hydrolase n=1 Tax=Leucocoprinus birnbaumii TaxID=56174 RepID=A0AAD5VT26_9AGAR|nr:hypothetical protein NP233_g5330 [Leucocoprinus birnbaumii]
MLLLLPLSCSVLSTFAVALAAQHTTIVDLGYARYQGTVNKASGNLEFLGIRYAAAPTGALRWREPQHPQSTPGVQLANSFPNICWQGAPSTQLVSPFRQSGSNHFRRQIPGAPPPSEDCLFLNIATPSSGKGDLPVVVWIHGGGYVVGSTFMFDGDDLIRQAGGQAVVVIIQYRLGLFGFLSSQKVKNGGALNAGLLDQQFALQWVQQHISKFGGDPKKVTIWGESAGAGSVLQHLIANNGNTQPPLFRGAITGSTFLPSQYVFNDRIPEQLYAEAVEQSGCSSSADDLDCLRQADIDALNRINLNLTGSAFFGTACLNPVVDGTLITKRPIELIHEGKVNRAAYLAVTNQFEGWYPGFVDNRTADTVQTPEYLANIFPEFTDKQITAGTAVYANQGPPLDQARAIMGDSIFICPTYYLLRAFKGEAFKGEFAIAPAFHGDDIVYYFPTPLIVSSAIAGVTPPYNNSEFINNFSQSFMNFVLYQDPNVKWDSSNTVPHWPRWNEDNLAEIVFNRTEEGEPVFHTVETTADQLRRCDYWQSVGPFSGQ